MRKFFHRRPLSDESNPTSVLPSGSQSSPQNRPIEINSLATAAKLPPSTTSVHSAPSTVEPDRRSSNNDCVLPNPRDAKDKRQVAFVSPDSTSPDTELSSHVGNSSHCIPTIRYVLRYAKLVTTRSHTPTPQPSHPPLRSSSAATHTHGSSKTVMSDANASSFHHPPANVLSPHRLPAGSSSWRSDGSTGSQSGSQLGHSSSFPSSDPSRDTCGDRITPTPNSGYRSATPLSTFSFSQQRKRGSAGWVGPADTWGGNVIGGRLGEDIYQPMTWSEMTDLDLVENLSGRERTRQEVMWEIVASEERYVSELVSLRSNYITPLLYPTIAPILLSPPNSSYRPDFSKACNQSPSSSLPTTLSPPTTASDFLPIASQFIRSSSRCSRNTHSNHSQDHLPDMASEDSHTFPTSSPVFFPPANPTSSLSPPNKSPPNRNRISLNRLGIRHRKTSNPDSLLNSQAVAGVHLSHLNQSSFSVPHANFKNSSTYRGIRDYLRPSNQSNKLQKAQQETIQTALMNHANFEYLLPESLKIILNVINEGMSRGHEDLSVKLKEKYLEQFPLVRDLTSVWAEQAWIIETYAIYVKHLERALRDIEQTLNLVNCKNASVPKEAKYLASIIKQLEENAAVQGECGLAICLSKPFQRLLKYPLLFQNLLYHTDASTHEYEGAQAMAISIDEIVKSIEDGKVSEEERDKARDVWSRIDGINEKALMVPLSDRLLMSEEPVWQPTPGKERRTLSDVAEGERIASPTFGTGLISPHAKKEKSTIDRLRILKGQKSFRRLSDMVGNEGKQPSLGSKRDIWLVVFSDVILRCQRVGLTRMSTSYPSVLKDKQKSRRLLPVDERNLYKFIKIERWEKHPSVVLKEANEAHAQDQAAHAQDNAHDVNNSTISQKERSTIQFTSDSTASQLERSIVQLNGADEFERIRRESAMSFSYDEDDPKPNIPSEVTVVRNNKDGSKSNSQSTAPPRKFAANPAPNARIVSPTTQSVIGKRAAAISKFSNRVPVGHQFQNTSGSVSACGSSAHPRYSGPASSTQNKTAPVGLQYRYETPTTSTLAKKTQATNIANPSRTLSPVLNSRSQQNRRRAGSISGSAPTNEDFSRSETSTRRNRASSIEDAIAPPRLTESQVSKNARVRNSIKVAEQQSAVSKKPSEDFSAFKSYFNTSLSSVAVAFPT